jgi:hypothetical protein
VKREISFSGRRNIPMQTDSTCKIGGIVYTHTSTARKVFDEKQTLQGITKIIPGRATPPATSIS